MLAKAPCKRLDAIAALGLLGLMAMPAQAADNIQLYFDDFDQNANLPDGPVNRDWYVLKNAGATVNTGDPYAALNINTTPDAMGPGSASLSGRRRFTIGKGLIFKARVLAAYVENVVYGDGQPRGLAQGGERNMNAIEFISSSPAPNGIACRTVKNGAVTQTLATIGHSVAELTNYQIIARATQVDFYVNGKRVCRHTTNIPTVALNPYFGTSDGGAGNVPLAVDWVSLEQIQ